MRKILTIGLLLLSCSVFAQNKSMLLGKWSVTFDDSEDTAIYEFRKENGGVIGYCISYTEGKEVEDGLNEKVVDKIKLEGKKGTGIFYVEDDGKKYKLKCKLYLKSNDKIEVKYSYLFYSGKQEWIRIKK